MDRQKRRSGSKQDDQPRRTEAIRRLVEIGLKAKK